MNEETLTPGEREPERMGAQSCCGRRERKMDEALALVRAHPEEKITTAFLQKNLKIPYPEAAALKQLFDLGAEEA